MSVVVGYWGGSGQPYWALLRQSAPAEWQVVRIPRGSDGAPGVELAGVDLLVSVWPLTAEHLRSASRLKLVKYVGVGVDAFDVDSFRRREIGLAITPQGMAVPLAEHTLMLILATTKQLLPLTDLVRAGAWPQWELRERSRTVADLDVGVVGLGRTGRRVAELLLSMGARVTVLDRHLRGLPGGAREQVNAVGAVEEIAASVDLLTLHVPLTTATVGLIDRHILASMRSGGFLVNTSRGEVVDEAALYDALVSGHLGGAGLDVLAQEPPRPDHPLLRLPNVVVTPHLATGTRDAARHKVSAVIQAFEDYLDGRPLADCVVQPREWARPS